MDEDADRDPEMEGEINSRREERAELEGGYREARQELPESPADDPWAYTELPTRNPADQTIPPLWEVLRDQALSVSGAERRGTVDFEEGLYLDRSPLPEYKVVRRIDQADVREALRIENSASQSTLNRMPGRMDSSLRTFYFNFAAHLYNIWTVANIRRAEELGTGLSEGKEFTAGRVMQAIEDDPYDLDFRRNHQKLEMYSASCFSPLAPC